MQTDRMQEAAESETSFYTMQPKESEQGTSREASKSMELHVFNFDLDSDVS